MQIGIITIRGITDGEIITGALTITGIIVGIAIAGVEVGTLGTDLGDITLIMAIAGIILIITHGTTVGVPLWVLVYIGDIIMVGILGIILITITHGITDGDTITIIIFGILIDSPLKYKWGPEHQQAEVALL